MQSAICEPAPGSELEGPLDEIEVPAPPAPRGGLAVPRLPSPPRQPPTCGRAPACLRRLGRGCRGAGMPSSEGLPRPAPDHGLATAATAPEQQGICGHPCGGFPYASACASAAAMRAQVTGYAYSGGGQPIIRVDVSADGGESWTTAQLQPIDARRYRCARPARLDLYGVQDAELGEPAAHACGFWRAEGCICGRAPLCWQLCCRTRSGCACSVRPTSSRVECRSCETRGAPPCAPLAST